MAAPLWTIDEDDVRLLGVRCRRCETVFFPPQEYGCEQCGAGGEGLDARPLPTSGRILGFARVHKHPTVETPFQIAEILLDAGPVVRARLEHDAPAVGQRVVGAAHPSADDREVVFVPEDRT